MQIEIRLIKKPLQLTKFQTFQRTFLDFYGTVMKLNNRLKSIADKTQIFITTHSPLFIDGYKMKNLFLLELSVTKKFSERKKDNGFILETKKVDLSKYDSIYLIKETLGIDDSDNLILGKKNLIVEGEEDKRYISELANFFNLPLCNIISTGGVTNFIKYLEFYNSICDDKDDKPKFILLYDNDEEGRKQFMSLKTKQFDKIETIHFQVIDFLNTNFPKLKNVNINIEIEDLIYPEIILELSNSVFAEKKGFKKVPEKIFRGVYLVTYFNFLKTNVFCKYHPINKQVKNIFLVY